MKTKKFLLPCIAAVAIATFVGAKSFKTNASESNELLLANVEALSEPPEEPYPQERAQCIAEGGNWNMASVCKDSGFETVTCKISGEVTLFGVTIKGSYEKNSKYNIPWARYECVQSAGNCCKKQGLYSGDTKLA